MVTDDGFPFRSFATLLTWFSLLRCWFLFCFLINQQWKTGDNFLGELLLIAADLCVALRVEVAVPSWMPQNTTHIVCPPPACLWVVMGVQFYITQHNTTSTKRRESALNKRKTVQKTFFTTIHNAREKKTTLRSCMNTLNTHAHKRTWEMHVPPPHTYTKSTRSRQGIFLYFGLFRFNRRLSKLNGTRLTFVIVMWKEKYRQRPKAYFSQTAHHPPTHTQTHAGLPITATLVVSFARGFSLHRGKNQWKSLLLSTSRTKMIVLFAWTLGNFIAHTSQGWFFIQPLCGTALSASADAHRRVHTQKTHLAKHLPRTWYCRRNAYPKHQNKNILEHRVVVGWGKQWVFRKGDRHTEQYKRNSRMFGTTMLFDERMELFSFCSLL